MEETTPKESKSSCCTPKESKSSCCTTKCSMSFCSGLKAGFAGAVVMAAIMAILGTDILKMLGGILLGDGASTALMYIAGGAAHLFVGMIFGLLYAIVFAPMCFMSKLIRAIVFGTVLTAVAYYATPILANKMQAYHGGETPSMDEPMEAAGMDYFADDSSMANNDNSFSIDTKAIMKSWVNHFIFALVVVLTYRPKCK